MIVPAADRLNTVEEYYFSSKLQEIRGMVARGIPVINLGIGNPDLPPSSATMDRLAASAHNAKNHGYQSYKGIPALREAIAGYLAATHDVRLDPETEILPLPGSKQGMIYIALAYLNPGDRALVSELSYPTYTSVSRLAGGNIAVYPLDAENNWAPRWAAMEKMDLTGVKLLWANYPHMPTGAPASRATLQRLVDFARERNILVAHDNPYAMLGTSARPISILSCDGGKDVAVELGSMSKSHNMAGWRIGWVTGRKDYVDTILRVASNVESGMFLPAQEAAIEALRAAPSWYTELQHEYARRRSLGTAILEQLGCTVADGQAGMFVWGRTPDHAPEAKLLSDAILRTTNVFITPGSIFGPAGERYLRLSLCSPADVLKAAVGAIRSFMIPASHPEKAS
jgi:LL-diaminopimelate aminotransferase